MTNSVVLRPLALGDVDNLMTWVNDPDVVGRFATFHGSFTREDEDRYIAGIISSKTDLVFSINAGGQYAGQVGLHEIEWRNRKGRAALVLRKELQGHGYGQKVLDEFLRILFGEYGIHKVYLIVDGKNERAMHVYRKLGFREEGILREEYLRDGTYHDVVRMSVLDHEYLASRAPEGSGGDKG